MNKGVVGFILSILFSTQSIAGDHPYFRVFQQYQSPKGTITESTSMSASIGTSYHYHMGQVVDDIIPSQANGVAPFAWSLASGALPSWLTLDQSTGAISGLAQSHGTISGISLVVVDSAGSSAQTNSFSIVVGYDDIVISNIDDASFVVGSSKNSIVPSASNIVNSATWSLAAGSDSLPDGLSLNTSTGVVSGTPNVKDQVKTVALQVVDSNGTKAVSNKFSISTYAVSISKISTVTTSVNVAFASDTPIVTHSTGSLTWSLDASSTVLPAWATLNTSSGVVTGTTTTATAISGIVLKVVDADGNTATSNSFSITAVASAASVYPTVDLYDYVDTTPSSSSNWDWVGSIWPKAIQDSKTQTMMAYQYTGSGSYPYPGVVYSYSTKVFANSTDIAAYSNNYKMQYYDGTWHEWEPGTGVIGTKFKFLSLDANEPLFLGTLRIGVDQSYPAYLDDAYPSLSTIGPGYGAHGEIDSLLSASYVTSSFVSNSNASFSAYFGYDGRAYTYAKHLSYISASNYPVIESPMDTTGYGNSFSVVANQSYQVQIYMVKKWYSAESFVNSPLKGFTTNRFRVVGLSQGSPFYVGTMMVGYNDQYPTTFTTIGYVSGSVANNNAAANGGTLSPTADANIDSGYPTRFNYTVSTNIITDTKDETTDKFIYFSQYPEYAAIKTDFNTVVYANDFKVTANTTYSIQFYESGDSKWHDISYTGMGGAMSTTFRILASSPNVPLYVGTFMVGENGVFPQNTSPVFPSAGDIAPDTKQEGSAYDSDVMYSMDFKQMVYANTFDTSACDCHVMYYDIAYDDVLSEHAFWRDISDTLYSHPGVSARYFKAVPNSTSTGQPAFSGGYPKVGTDGKFTGQ